MMRWDTSGSYQKMKRWLILWPVINTAQILIDDVQTIVGAIKNRMIFFRNKVETNKAEWMLGALCSTRQLGHH